MKTSLYWFSGTGNSLSVARAVSRGLGDAELIPIPQAGTGRPADRIGLIFPVYAWGPPAIVARFVERLAAREGTYVFAVMTYGGDPGSAAAITRGMLRRRRLNLAAAYGVCMPENYPPLGGAPPPQKQHQILADAQTRIAQVVAALRASPRGHIEKGSILWRGAGRLIYPMFRWRLPKSDRKFLADDKCDSCGLCAKVCPVGDIEMVDGRPRWLGRCEQCYACFHWCPQRAIQYGRKTADQVRYHHPDAKASDLTARQSPTQGGPGSS